MRTTKLISLFKWLVYISNCWLFSEYYPEFRINTFHFKAPEVMDLIICFEKIR